MYLSKFIGCYVGVGGEAGWCTDVLIASSSFGMGVQDVA